jgi:hypothetical protein
MRRPGLGIVVMLAIAAAAVMVPASGRWRDVALVVGGFAAIGLGTWVARCRHASPLALLPATTDHLGAHQPSRWFCDACGATWPAVFDRPAAPIQKFVGYDETKLVEARRRQKAHEDQARTLAIHRAGLTPRAVPAPRAAANVVPMREREKGRSG